MARSGLGATAFMDCISGRLDAETLRANTAEERSEFYGDLLKRVTIDSRFGILTFNAQEALCELMVKLGYLGDMRARGYMLETHLYDIDKLKTHNNLGDHSGGDEAIGRIVARLRERVYRRKGDQFDPGKPTDILAYLQEIEDRLKSGEGFTIFSRLEGGDELFGLRFHPPAPVQQQTPGDHRKPVVDPYERRDSIVAALDGLTAEYPLAVNRYKAWRMMRQFGLRRSSAVRTDDEGRAIIRVPVSATFGIAYTPVPASLEEFKGLRDMVDRDLMRAKANRRAVKTGGVVVSMAA